MDVSVVVCTYNRARLLAGALASLAQQRTGDRFQYEVVVVDNGSTDETPRVVEEAARRSAERRAAGSIRRLCEPRPGVAQARNCGVRNARGRWIAFFDDDQLADPDWLARLLEAAQRTGARCVSGAVRLQLPDAVTAGLPAVCRSLLGESLPREQAGRPGRRRGLATGNLLVQRAVFDEIGPFDESLQEAGEDADLGRRVRAAGIELAGAPSAVVWHVIPPYRVGEDYLRWSAHRQGMHVARRERWTWGRFALPAMAVVRLGQAIGAGLPRWFCGSAVRSRRLRLDGLCRLWRSEGYLRFALLCLAPRWFAQHDFFARTAFRTERELFTSLALGTDTPISGTAHGVVARKLGQSP
jgi:cellulose synthase/poly-beta-1,6-N-acetylglucosamine synthase-like glycosyltransferase